MLWLACHNSKIDWRTEKINITRCLDKYGKILGTKARIIKIKRRRRKRR